MKLLHFIGADLSKKTIDFACYQGPHLKVQNNRCGFRAFLDWLKCHQINVSQSMMVMEHTGLYSYQLEQFLHQEQLRFTKVSALAIKRSMGLVRGKTDKVDAMRIARYGFEKQDQLSASPPTDQSLQRLQLLQSTRERLVKNRASLLTAVKEYREVLGLKDSDVVMRSQLQLIKDFDGQLGNLQKEIAAVVAAQKNLACNYELLQSIKGVGKILALTTLIKTANFSRFTDARKFACFCGTAPFEHRSGSSIRGRTQVSHMADKRMKSLLDLAAKSAIQYDKELRQYYLKRTAEGKPKMSTINVVRNKLLYRMFAVIKRQTPFTDNYLNAA